MIIINPDIVRNDSAAAEAVLLRMPPYESHLYITPNSVSTRGNCQPGSVAVGFGTGLCTYCVRKKQTYQCII